jgi:hypothetical protein
MRTPRWLSTVLSLARAASFVLALVALCTPASGALAGTIHFPGFPDGHGDPGARLLGISLADLVEGEEFESRDGKLVFGDFEAEIEGHALRNLDLCRVFPTADGFKLFSPLMVILGADAKLTLDYKVATTEEELVISSASLSFLGFALGDAEAWVEESLLEADGDPLGALAVFRTGFFNRGQSRDHLDLDNPLGEIYLDEIIGVRAGGKHCVGGFAKALVTDHSFEVVPEPTTALLLAVGLVGLGGCGGGGAGAD